ncbi:MAG: isocitrate/isopropylmalate family dehydrogenase [Candidatus Methanoperedens sp.]|uniref:isocitrate/isopropylmalate dehydrogenase family protein n=1 Tax=Candidatus Methanoperedens sp. BLZ2 TaxID=2035255 RepID=UPI000BE2708A|nr:isocitrate/isopropylmalate family dehydrogenase [Candidatus Methanoperedens sp. BLZ2]KAB2947156.1 MAG: NAD-dependent isocitrate dehydrogenase [Candidatus Methanoperedens sp.]MBZ0175194.1 NAD-dependent isocitrate dehydrogenase [Candidatus Methanoperedens nitroreducens]MCX9078310.1 isocitrate/isopropylmalate family dehydrogenase [Candidatus Methanoperedens sp.]
MKVAIIPGDGIGKEVLPAALSVLDVFGVDIEKVPLEIGFGKWEKTGSAITDDDIALIKQCDCVLFGAITTVPDPDYKSVLVRIRKELDLYANIRPFTPLKKVKLPCAKKFDFVIVRENTEGMYSGVEELHEDVAYSTRIITRKGSTRIAEKACKIAKMRKKQLTIVHKANVLKSDSFFRDVCTGVAKKNDIRYNEMFVDAMAYDMILHPEKYDVIVTTNLFGDILSDEAAAMVGGLGLCPSANIGDKYAFFEPIHGSAPDIAGKGIANPIAAILSVKMMLEWAGFNAEAKTIGQAVNNVLDNGIVTPDLGGSYSTLDVSNAITKLIR